MMNLMRSMRISILEGTFPEFVDRFLRTMFSSEQPAPQWVKDALNHVGVPIDPMLFSIGSHDESCTSEAAACQSVDRCSSNCLDNSSVSKDNVAE